MARLRSALSRSGATGGRLLRRAAARAALPRGRFWLRLRLPSPLPELPTPGFPGRESQLSLLEVLQALAAAARDERVAGVVVRMTGAPGGIARAEALQRALLEVRETGRPVVVWSERLSTLDLLAASGGSHVLLPESGGVFPVGLRLEGWFLRGLLDRIGLRADVVRVGDFKSAGEMFTREESSSAYREEREALADELYAALVEALGVGRGLEPARVHELVDGGPYPARAAQDLGLIDGCCYPDELEATLNGLVPDVGEPDAVPLADARAYLTLRARDAGEVAPGPVPRIAYVVASGGIHAGHGMRGVASDSFRALFDRLARDEGLAGVIVRIDSPGGDAVASDLLWRALRQVRDKRPVVASLGDVAASGGYFLAAAADAVLLEAGSVTGSIGVVGGKLDASGLYERLGIRKEAVERGARAGLLAEDRAFTQEERRAVRAEMQVLYDLFVDRVATGRKLEREAVHRVGGGRVFGGRRAKEAGLADAIGGPLEALAELRQRAGLPLAGRVRIEVHPRIGRLFSLQKMLRPWRLGSRGRLGF